MATNVKMERENALKDLEQKIEKLQTYKTSSYNVAQIDDLQSRYDEMGNVNIGNEKTHPDEVDDWKEIAELLEKLGILFNDLPIKAEIFNAHIKRSDLNKPESRYNFMKACKNDMSEIHNLFDDISVIEEELRQTIENTLDNCYNNDSTLFEENGTIDNLKEELDYLNDLMQDELYQSYSQFFETFDEAFDAIEKIDAPAKKSSDNEEDAI